jgi:hypothetical protein
MNKNNLSKFTISLVALLSVVSCNINSPSKTSSINGSSENSNNSSDVTPISSDSTPISSDSGSSSSEIKESVILSGVSAKKEFTLFEQHKNRSSDKDDGFFDHSQTYKVGDDNAKRYIQQLGDDAYNNGYKSGRGDGFKTGAAAASIVILAGGLIFRGFKKLRNRSKNKDKADA